MSFAQLQKQHNGGPIVANNMGGIPSLYIIRLTVATSTSISTVATSTSSELDEEIKKLRAEIRKSEKALYPQDS